MKTMADRDALVLEHLNVVRLVARKIWLQVGRHVAFDDLYQDGVIGLLTAAVVNGRVA